MADRCEHCGALNADSSECQAAILEGPVVLDHLGDAPSYVPWDQACSFTCPLTCEGPGDPDHESQAERTARLARQACKHPAVLNGVCFWCNREVTDG